MARFLDDPGGALTRRSARGAVLGSIEYLAPEQAVDSHAVDIRADIYSLGATFYFLLTGKPPFDRHSLMRIAAGAIAYPPPLAQLRPDVSPGLVHVVEKMMALQPADRYQTPADAAMALQGELVKAPSSSKALPAAEERVNGWLTLLVYTAVAVLAGLVAAAICKKF